MTAIRLIALSFALVSCEIVTDDDPTPTAGRTPTADDTGDVDPTDTGPAVLPAEDYTLNVEEGAETTRWKFGNGIFAKLCATINGTGDNRVLRVYPTTVTAEYVPFCADSGAFEDTALTFSGSFIQTAGEGRATISDSFTGTVVDGDTAFDDDQTAELIVEITNPNDATIAPAQMALTVSTTTTELSFTFAKAP